LKIGPVRIAHPIGLAPMEEHTNYPLRRLMKQFGASLVCSERVDSIDVARRDRRALRLLHTMADEAPRAGQISGADPATMAEAARVVEELGFDLVDLNFECPIRRLVQRGEGGALLADPSAIERIVRAVVRAASIPVTLKIRTGPSREAETASDVARAAEAAGARAIGLHARSVEQAYVGGADWESIGRVKEATSLPIFASGGVRSADDALRLLKESGAEGVSIGRGALGNPWIFAEARALHAGGARPAVPSAAERGRVLLRLATDEFHLYGPTVAVRRLPRVACYFAKAIPGFAEFRAEIQRVRTLAELRSLIREHFTERASV
jgi:tRNA-dihydrouridine synthase B